MKHDNNMRDNQVGDPRWQALEFGLNQLTTEQLHRIVTFMEASGSMVYDEFNYDESRGLWCPLAVGLGVPELIHEGMKPSSLTDSWAKGFITEVGQGTCRGFTLNPISGIPGRVYRHNRAGDILAICRFLISYRDSECSLTNKD